MALSIRQNDQIRGIPLKNHEAKISLFADDSVCFLDGSYNSFSQLFDTLSNFGKYSRCKILSDLDWFQKGCQGFPYTNRGVSWKTFNLNVLESVFL